MKTAARPIQRQLRTVEEASWGAPRPKLEVLSFRPMRRNTLVGFVTVRLGNRLKINDCLDGEAGS